ncbi:MAG: hypothetical protein GXP01_04495 [Alphaproteobacteria bacterium]|nr:hypothetical protein [Alphaproteobacteria bacterium]
MTDATGKGGRARRDNRDGAYDRLRRRSILVHWLRWTLPVGGVLILVALGTQVFLGRLIPGLEVAGIRIEADRIVVEGPTIEGTLAGGGRYVLRADTAQGKAINAREIELTGLGALLEMADGAIIDVTAGRGVFDYSGQRLVLTDSISLTGPDGQRGILEGGTLDVPRQRFTSTGTVRFDLPGGGVLEADEMEYQANRGRWRFDNVRLVINPENRPSDIGLRGTAQ